MRNWKKIKATKFVSMLSRLRVPLKDAIKINERLLNYVSYDINSDNTIDIYQTRDDYVTVTDDLEIEIDINAHFNFRYSEFVNHFGDEFKLCQSDWSSDRYAIPINNNLVFDSFCGIKSTNNLYYQIYNEAETDSNPVPVDFIERPLDYIQCGFELETQETECEINSSDDDDYCGEIPDFEVPADVEVVSDESVAGFEFRTIGGRTPYQFITDLESVFELDHHINVECSFHIHLRVDGMFHYYDPSQRQRIINYLFEHADELPESVRNRWKSERARRFFLVDDGDRKFNFINFHGQGTIEFRCFGNVQNVEDGIKCLDLAVRALQSSYRDVHVPIANRNEWKKHAIIALESGDTESMKIFSGHQAKLGQRNKEYLEYVEANLDMVKKLMTIPKMEEISKSEIVMESSPDFDLMVRYSNPENDNESEAV
jgi:hypothetical protein